MSVCDNTTCATLERAARHKCTQCDNNLCTFCSKQGFECLECHMYCCSACESDVDWMHCQDCKKS